MSPRVVLIGPPGAGKSTVAVALAQRLGMTSLDTDDVVADRAGKAVADIFLDDGEIAFRELEREAVAQALRDHDGVLALGGGAVMDPLTEQALAGHHVVFLDVGVTHAARRVGLNSARPLLVGNPRAQWIRLMQHRRPVYERVAAHVVQTDDRTPDDVAAAVQDALR